jgi:hypothetical protein
VSLRRIEYYLAEDEVPDWASALSTKGERVNFDGKPKEYSNTNGVVTNGNRTHTHDDSIGFYDAETSWHTASGINDFRLTLDVRFRKGINLIIGATGSGKVLFSTYSFCTSH